MSQRPDGFSSSQLSRKEKADNNPLEYRDAISSSNENITTIIGIRPFSSIHKSETTTKSTKNTKISQSSGTIAKVIPGTEVDSLSASLESDTGTTDNETDSEWEKTVKLLTQYSTNKEKRTKFIKKLRDKTKELNRKTPDIIESSTLQTHSENVANIAESSTSRTPLNQKNIQKSQIREFLKQRNINKSQFISEEIENDSELAKEVAFLCKNPKYKATLQKYIRNHVRRIQKSKMSNDSCDTNVETSQLPSTMQSKTTTGATSPTQCISDEISMSRTSEVPITKDDQLKNRSEISPSEHSNSGPDPEFQLGSETQTTQISSTTTNETKSHTEKIDPQNTCKIIPKIQVPRNTNPENSKTSEKLLPINTENSTCEKNQSTSQQLSPKYPSSQPNESYFAHDSRESENLSFSNTDYQASVKESTSEIDKQLRYFTSASSTPKSSEKAQFIPNVELKATSAPSRILIRTTDKSPPKTDTSVSELAKIHSEEGSKTPWEVAQISSTFLISEHNTNAEDTIPEKLSVFSNDTLQMSGIPSNSTNENKDSQNNLAVPIITKDSSPKTKQQASSKAQNTDPTLHSLNYFDTSLITLIEYLIQNEDSDTSIMSYEFLNSTNENKTEESENSLISSPFPDIDDFSDINPMVIQATEIYNSTTSTSLHSQNITTSQNTPDIILEHTASIENSSQEADQTPAPSTPLITNLHAPTSSPNNTDDKTISGSHSLNDLETCFMTAAEHLIRSEKPKISTCEREIVNAPIETPNETTGSSRQKDDLTNKIYSLVQLINDQLSTLSNSYVIRHSSTTPFPSINTLSSVESSMQASEQTFPSINTSSTVESSMQASEQITEENLVTKSDILRPIMPEIIIPLRLPTFSCSASSITGSYKVSAYSILSTREIKSKPELLELVIKYVIEESLGPKNNQQSNQTSSKSDKRTPYSAGSDFLTFNLSEFSTPTFSSDHEQQSTAETQEISITCEPSSSGIQNTRSSSEAALTKGVEQQAESSSPHTSTIKDHLIHEGNENSISEGELTKEVQKQAESSFPHIIKDHHIHESNENSTSEEALKNRVEQQAELPSPHIIRDHHIHVGNENLPSTRHLEGVTNLPQTSTLQPPNNVMLPASPPPYSFYPQSVNLPAALPPPPPFKSNSNIRNIYPITDEDPFIQASYIRRFGRLSLPPHSEINFHIHPRSNNCRPSPSPEQRSLTLEEYFGRHPQIIPPPREFMGQEQNQAFSNPNPESFQQAFPSRGDSIIPPPDEFNTNPSSLETNQASASGLSEITPRTEIFSADRRLFIDSVERNQQEIPGTSQTTESESNNDEKNDSKKRSYLRWVPGGIYKHLKDKKKKKGE